MIIVLIYLGLILLYVLNVPGCLRSRTCCCVMVAVVSYAFWLHWGGLWFMGLRVCYKFVAVCFGFGFWVADVLSVCVCWMCCVGFFLGLCTVTLGVWVCFMVIAVQCAFLCLLWVVYFCCGLGLMFGFVEFGVTPFEPIACLVLRFGGFCDCCLLLLG